MVTEFGIDCYATIYVIGSVFSSEKFPSNS